MVYTALAATGVILSAVYLLWMLQRVVFGELTNPKNAKLEDMNTREIVMVAPLIVLMVIMGVAPNLFLRSMHADMEKVQKAVVKVAKADTQQTKLAH